MRHRHALRAAGRTRREQRVRRIIARQRSDAIGIGHRSDRQVRGTLTGDDQGADILGSRGFFEARTSHLNQRVGHSPTPLDEWAAALRRLRCEERPRRASKPREIPHRRPTPETHRRLQHVPHPIGGCVGGDRHILPTRGHDRMDRHQQFHRAVDGHAHGHIRTDTLRDQFAGKSIDPRTELGIRHTTPTEPQRGPAPRPRGLRRDEVDDRLTRQDDIGAARTRERTVDDLARNPGHISDRQCGPRRQSVEDPNQPVGEHGDGRFVEQIRRRDDRARPVPGRRVPTTR